MRLMLNKHKKMISKKKKRLLATHVSCKQWKHFGSYLVYLPYFTDFSLYIFLERAIYTLRIENKCKSNA